MNENPDTCTTVERVCRVIRERMQWPHAESVGPQTSFGDVDLALDSVMVIELAVHLENEFGIRIPDETIASFAEMDVEGVSRCIDSLHPCVAAKA